jgi:hypothetical protein
VAPSQGQVIDLNALIRLMKFILSFDGELPSTGNRRGKSKSPYIWKIRKALHLQIEELFRIHPALKTVSGEKDLHYFDPIDVKGHNFIPVARKELRMICGLKILFLRKQGGLIHSGDIDNRIKTLFDALRMPDRKNPDTNLDDEAPPDPMYVLLEDDSLITSCAIDTDVLLGSPPSWLGLKMLGGSVDKNDVRIIMEVTVKMVGGGNTWLGLSFLEQLLHKHSRDVCMNKLEPASDKFKLGQAYMLGSGTLAQTRLDVAHLHVIARDAARGGGLLIVADHEGEEIKFLLDEAERDYLVEALSKPLVPLTSLMPKSPYASG